MGHHTEFYPTYVLHEDLNEDTAHWLSEQQGDGPLRLIDITDVCATMRVCAVLRDEVGFTVGSVDANSNYRLER